jgi:D-glycero-D-manno-heptose 1,7-bisphosphate phosphatase
VNKAFFLDRDGTINVDYDFVHKPDEWTFCEEAPEAIRILNEQGFKVIVVTNQSGIARGHFSMHQVEELHTWVNEQLAAFKAHIDAFYIAAHHPHFDADKQYEPADRKPGTGMFLKAATRFNIDFSQSHMAGDKITDLIPAVELGMKPYFVRSRFEESQDKMWLKEKGIDIYDSLHQIIKSVIAGD